MTEPTKAERQLVAADLLEEHGFCDVADLLRSHVNGNAKLVKAGDTVYAETTARHPRDWLRPIGIISSIGPKDGVVMMNTEAATRAAGEELAKQHEQRFIDAINRP